MGVILLIGDLLRHKIKVLEQLRLPASLVGGCVGLVFFELIRVSFGQDTRNEVVGAFCSGWGAIPRVMTTVIFGGLVLGQSLASPVDIWKQAGNHLLYGLAVVFGQYTACAFAVYYLLSEANPYFAPVVPYGFQGGHGVVGGLKGAFEIRDYGEGYNVGLAAASLGLLIGVTLGSTMVNWAAERDLLVGLVLIAPADDEEDGLATASAIATGEGSAPMKSKEIELIVQAPSPSNQKMPKGSSAASKLSFLSVASADKTLQRRASSVARNSFFKVEQRPAAGEQVVGVEAIDTLAYHVSLVGVAVAGGVVMKELCLLMVGQGVPLPLFPFCLVSSVILQVAINKFEIPVDRPTIERVVNTAQDIMIVAGMALLETDAVWQQGLEMVLCSALATIWGLFAFFVLAKFMCADYFYERGLIEMGLTLGSTATGLLLLRMGDPENKTPVLRQFGYKQIVHVMITGGGLFDAFALNLVDLGSGTFLAICTCIMLFCIVAGRVKKNMEA